MDQVLYIIGAVLAFESLLKAIEWGIGKITSQHDTVQKIDENAISLEEYIKKNDARVAAAEKKIEGGHKKAFEVMDEMKVLISEASKESNKECMELIKEHRDEYMKRIESVENSITQMSAVYQQTVAVIDVKIENLEKNLDKSQTEQIEALRRETQKHNQIIERTYECEAKLRIHDEQFRVANARLKKIDGQGSEDDKR